MGVYDKFYNTVAKNAPAWMRERAQYMLFKLYDTLWTPVLQDVFPKTTAPLVNGKPASINTSIVFPFGAEVGSIGQYHDQEEIPKAETIAANKEEVQGRMTRVRGPNIDPTEFTNELRNGFLEKKNQAIVANSFKKISRLVEYELSKYVQLNEPSMRYFGNQYTFQSGRFKRFDAAIASGSEGWLGGTAWSDSGADILEDFNKIELYANDFGQTMKKAFVGPSTAFGLENNVGLYDIIKYHYDATKVPIATSIKGTVIQKVIGQFYKDNTGNAHRVGYPGIGDVRPIDRTTVRPIRMMTETISGATQEFALFVSEDIGNVISCAVHPKQTDVNVPYGHSWVDPASEIEMSYMSYGFTPYIEDASRMIMVRRTSVQLT